MALASEKKVIYFVKFPNLKNLKIILRKLNKKFWGNFKKFEIILRKTLGDCFWKFLKKLKKTLKILCKNIRKLIKILQEKLRNPGKNSYEFSKTSLKVTKNLLQKFWKFFLSNREF